MIVLNYFVSVWFGVFSFSFSSSSYIDSIIHASQQVKTEVKID